ncbi:unnamed protein product, partial [Brenthis ino]
MVRGKTKGVDGNFLEETRGNANIQNGTAKFRFESTNSSASMDFWIIITDYNNLAVGYACENLNTTHRSVLLWQLGRTTSFPTDMMEGLLNRTVYTYFGVTSNDLISVDHSATACEILPVIPDGQPVILPGQCDPNKHVVQNFNVTGFMGVWHQISTYFSTNGQGTCNRAQYTLSGNVVNVLNSQVVNLTLDTISGTAIVASNDGSARLLVTLEVTPGNMVQQPLWILATDYTDYAVAYTCADLAGNQRRVNAWIASRSRQLTPAAQIAVNEVIRSELDLNNRYLIPSNQTDAGCFFYPTPVPNQPVTFRGQCDPNTAVVQNFNVSGYLGIWHSIESYPSVFAPGTCNNAHYTLGNNVVDVFNTQVINQTLDTMTGTAVVNSTDGSAKLLVSFPVGNTNVTVSTNYWVLATDYSSFALVYSCININDDERQVFSWKLSRTKQLPINGTTVINEIISTIPVLDQRYYQVDDQTPAGCFYYPEPKQGVPVRFPGQCEDIPVTPNFDMTRFQGTWYEIQAYPKEQQAGQCVSHNFQLFNNAFNLTSFSVIDQFSSVSNGTATITSTDNSAKMLISITSNGQQIEIPYWILDTDYTNYALAYSCVNVDTDFRMVYSWKLSKTKELSTEQLALINNTISRVTVLEERYFEKIDQSADACATLPVISLGQPIILDGQCDPNIQAVQNFNLSSYLGRWRLIESYYQESQDGSCNEATYTLNADNSTVSVYNTQVLDQQLSTITGSARAASDDGSGKLLVTFPGTPAEADYWVLDTDYNSFALVYSCRNLTGNQRRIYSWKLSRTRELSADANTRINSVMNSVNVLNQRYFARIEHSDSTCFYYPEADGNPVMFRGQCNESIPVVDNFNPQAYMNTWYDIESYPVAFQNGTCPTATYTLGANVDVFNTQVVNQQLDTINGVAVLTGPANIAKLNVTFPIAGTNLTAYSPYWVLGTDYTNFALVYSCVNINDEYFRVSSWKLSRTKQLNAAATTAINNLMSTVQVLDNRYYINRNHTDPGCFYFPVPQPGTPVVFPGQCDQTIQAVPNFNMNAFQGTWYEIEAYPKDEQTGQCVSHQYSLNGTNILDLISSSITNQLRDITNSTVTLASAQDSSGKLNIILTSGGSYITIPFWILSTDYNDYALAYSCVNRDQNSRAVYSWKLSKSKTLSASGNNTINNKISEIDVLDNKYYEKIDQSDAGCFYLPETNPGEPVLFDGQCDPNIPVVQNFNATAYAGRWRMIESYASEFQNSAATCSEATYTLSGGIVDVYNTQVINQRLDVINGNATLATTDGSAKLIVNFPNAPVPSDYWVLSTDYNSYALVYSCRNVTATQRRVYSWKLSRTRELSANATTEINRVMNSVNVLNQRYYARIEHSDSACFYYPEADGNPVTFRGQCNESIPVVDNFNPQAYMNTWYDIESYPVAFQNGTCPTATYTLGANVDVFNTQVVNQQLDTINGVAVLTGPANIAKLNVAFPIAGTNLTAYSPYWVLGTDYTNFALVYSCVNINEEYFRVSSWKLSRTKQLTAAATTAINNLMSTVQVLDNRYYINRNHTDPGCFYFPVPQPGTPVVFPGQCDQTIQAVPNFNMNAFQGTWYEIEAYPKDEQTGQCVSHQYSLNGTNILDLISSSITNQLRDITNSTVTLASAQDSSGKLNIILTSGGSYITIPFWILSTDYNDYALAYSCVNRDQNSRAVYSWKLSKSKTLSASGNNTINNKIAEIDVLDNKYYEKIDQSDAGCFYLPETNPGEPVLFDGQCDPNIPVVQNFNATAYAGRWRMIESYTSEFQNSAATCSEATYTLSGGIVDVYNTQVINQRLDVINGNATLATTDGSAKLIVNFPNAPVPSDYWVLSTDYNSYALVYSCRNVTATQRRVYSWKLSRTRELSANATTEINRVMNSVNVLNQRYYARIEHSDSACFYYPEADGNPVTFRGQCNESIPVVDNFNPQAYMNTWYDVESYPVVFQNGTCPTATYTLGANVDVFNTQVVNQQLDTINGVAVLTGPANIAKLNVTFPIAGTNLTAYSPYWVLGTDYTNFALVYSCVNINEEYFRVSSWKLSRTKQLNAAATTAINNLMSTVQVLDNRYYINRNHTDPGCFYFPVPQPGTPVVFPGQCDQTIQAVPNFNMNAFQGTWYEIEAYPKDEQTGQCVSHQYSLNGTNILDLISSSITNQLRDITNSTVTLASAQDSSGKLNIILTSGGSYITIPFWILSTDYNDYALAYSCVNRDQNSRAVYSWKLSKSKTLSASGNITINNKIAEIDVLDNKYYEKIDQSDAGCFYLPETNPGEPVLFDGQCDPNIPVVQNFNATAYAGRWRMIESYASEFQNSAATCSEATYTLSGGIVDVYNTQVINQRLDVINGNATLATTDGSAKLIVNFPNAPVPSDYWVLSTDYNSYALVYSCRNVTATQRRVYSWKLSRTRELSANATTEINRVMNSVNVLNQRYYARIEHSDSACFYYPEADGNPVTFRGQCNESIPVVDNFNPRAYMNTWYDIESYPERFQDGTCPTATYTLGANVDVFNTQVVNQQLDTMNGFAVLTGPANIAKLNVTFPIAGTNLTTSSPYWVLATDYSNYALVYSCVNMNEEYFRISSWKLSRQKSLAPASVAAINTTMNSIPVLRQQYFVARGHTEENCFYYPNNNGGPVVLEGQCESNVAIVNNFNPNAFAGSWYEIYRFPSELQDGECVSSQFNFTNQEFLVNKNYVARERMISLDGRASFATDGRGIINVTLSGQEANFQIFYVMDVNYTDYALLYNCRSINNTHKQVYSWKLSRSQQGLSAEAERNIGEIVNRTRDLFQGYYEITDQTTRGCFHYPEFAQLPYEIELIGSCDPTIRAKANFNVQDYLGKWYEIESYPQPFQFGQCARAQYSLTGDFVTVLNSQVVNNTLAVQNATAVVASDDGSGLLNVTFVLPNNVTNTVNYYVLETDYTSFALVYSCRNLTNGNRTVSSWKLSRFTTLSPLAIPIINSIVDNTEGLHQPYYRSTDQSDAACFYIPDVNKNQAPEFRGQCENIQGLQGFEAHKFLGWWHEIESYPTDNVRGDCRSSEYKQVGNDFQLVETSVTGLSAQMNTSDVTITNNGQIIRIRPDGGEFDRWWVLATDYDNYALLYSCVNVNSTYRRVWSAKYSKSRSLDVNSQNAMAAVIQNTTTLETRFFLITNQSDSACFYYPEPTGNPVILPGTCDESIPVVQNFSTASYSGDWYQIERYPQIHENGTCVGARYTLNTETNVVEVLNWQVVNGVLDEVRGNATVNSTDGSARLLVNLPVRFTDDPEPMMVSMNLYVLATDYVSYSLAYSCVDVNPYRRAVGVWKLSRNRTMPEIGQRAINATIESRPELNHDYFISVEQNDDCPEPDPEPSSAILVNSSIIIMLICTILHLFNFK